MRDYSIPLTAAELEQKRKADLEESERRLAAEEEEQKGWLTAEKLAENARLRHAWIYDPQIRRWYTPEEFKQVYGSYYPGHHLFNQVKIKDPNEGVEAGYKQIENLQRRLLAFSKKVMEYYRGK